MRTLNYEAEHYSRLAPFIREYIYEKKWRALKNIQSRAIEAILDNDGHVLIAAGTAAGKTEACFFPILTLLSREEPIENGISILYISPLKALINDQFERLAPLFSQANIPLMRWHGDVGKTHKQRVLEKPQGLLQITPESLEALLLRHPGKILPLFQNLVFAVIDEVHAFMGQDRGSQLVCLLERIREISGSNPRRIGLSATLGDYEKALEWLRQGTEQESILIRGSGNSNAVSDSNIISLAVDYFQDDEYYPSLYNQCRGVRKCIIFTNSRAEAEESIAALKAMAVQRGEEDHYHVHHGSIAASLRAEAEKKLKEKDEIQCIAATATLELGIDIGKLDRIIQIGPPMGVTNFVQRLGRSGRQSGISQMYFTWRESANLTKEIPWALLKTIAVIQLYLEEQWTESAEERPLAFSLLCHQTLSILASLGEHGLTDLSRRVLQLPVFRKINPEDYLRLLRSLLEENYIEKTGEGKIILGLAGERIVNHYSFYSVFPDEEEFRVSFGGRELGKVNFIPPEGAILLLGGKSWQVDTLDLRGRLIAVSPGTGEGGRIWRGGSSSLHTRIVRRMRRVLEESTIYPYLTGSAEKRLREARDLARAAGFLQGIFIPIKSGEAENIFLLVPWLGSRGMRSLSLVLQKKEYREILKIQRHETEDHYGFRIVTKLGMEDFRTEIGQLISGLDDPESLIDSGRIPYTDKYDYLLPPELLVKQYCANMLNLAELKDMNFG